MNILNILYFSPEVGGGIVKHLIVLGRVAKSKGHNLILGFPKIRKWQDELQSNSKVIIIAEIEKPLRSGFPHILREICKMHSIDIIHFHFLFALPFSLVFSIKRCNIPIIHHWHNPPIALNEFQTEQKRLKGRLKRLSSGIVARFTDYRVINQHISMSNEISELLVKNKWTTRNKISFIPNGVSLIDSTKVIQWKKPNSLPIIGTVANFRPQKDYETLLKAFNILRKAGLLCELWIIGDGPTRPSMEKLADELGIKSSVRFLGTLSNPSEMFRKFDVFVLSTHYEGHPLVLLEAMSFGIPIVATRISSIPEVITDGVNGLLVNHKDYFDMAQALNKILTDKLLHLRLSEAATGTFKSQPTVDDWAQQVISLYELLIKSKTA